jgi:RNA polymerase sigma factor (sigma-70 family)
VEVSALKPTALPGPRGSGSLLRLQSDERLIALTRRGQQSAFEALFSRYHARLLAFCRHMLNSKEDAEDVLQEVFVAAFNAILADEREINVRPWLYRIARNRSLNHLRRASAIGVDSMDIHYADHGMSTGEQVLRRESFRQLIGDVQKLPETQRTALLLREIDALSYEQISQAMETTVPSVKSLLVRARISLAEAAEARQLSCEEVRVKLGEAAEGLIKVQAAERRHLRDCERCRNFRKHLKDNNHALAAILPVGPLLLFKKFLLTKFGSTASAGGAHAVGAGGATAGASAAASAGAAGGMGMGGLATAGAGALATKAAATLAAAALVTAGAVEVDHSGSGHSHRHHGAPITAAASASAAAAALSHHVYAAPSIARSTPQPTSSSVAGGATLAALAAHRRRAHKHPVVVAPTTTPPDTTTEVSNAIPVPIKPPAVEKAPVTQVTTESTPLPSPSDTSTTTATTPVAPPAETSPPPAETPAAETAPAPETAPPAPPAAGTETGPTITPVTPAPATGATTPTVSAPAGTPQPDSSTEPAN